MNRINKGFKSDKDGGVVCIVPNKLSAQTLNAIIYVMQFIISNHVITQDVLINEIIDVIEKQDLNFDKVLFLKQADRIMICILMLLHNTNFEYGGAETDRLRIHAGNSFISHNRNFVDSDGKPVDVEETFGKLSVQGFVTLKNEDKDFKVCHDIFTTNLDVSEWCEDDLFSIEAIEKALPNHLFKKVNLDLDLTLSRNFKLTSA